MSRAARYTTWTFTAYPESLPEGWERQLSDLHVPCAYVLHDSDVDEHGEPLKPHYHVLMRYDSLKTIQQVQADIAFTGIQYVEVVRSFRSMCRYLCHLDDPDKHQYDRESVVSVSGMSLDFSRRVTRDEELRVLSDITQFVEDNDICEFAVIWNHAARHESMWLDVLAGKNAYGISQYIRSRKFTQDRKRSAGALSE